MSKKIISKKSIYDSIIVNLENPQYLSGINYDYDDDKGYCECGEYCRCGKISNFRLLELDITKLINSIIDTKVLKNPFDVYAADRVIRAAKLTKESFEGIGVSGYYGEELSISLNQNQLDFIEGNLLAVELIKTNIDKIKFLLNLEYGYLLDVIKDAKSAEIISIDKYKIVHSQEEYRKKVPISEYYSQEYTLPTGIVREVSLDRYRILDGYHRTFSNSKLNSIDVILIK